MTVILALMGLNFVGCGTHEAESTEVQVFIAASLNSAMAEIAGKYETDNPRIKIIINADGSGKLMTQIEEGYACDIFFSAAEEQMNRLEDEGYIIPGTRADILNNKLVVITGKNSGTSVTGLSDIGKAQSFALAGESVPAGMYTRQAFINMDLSSDMPKGVEISEQDNVSKVLNAVIEKSCEVGTVYMSDTIGHENELDILEVVPSELTGSIIYPIARVKNDEAADAENSAADDFIKYVLSDDSKKIFEKYGFAND